MTQLRDQAPVDDQEHPPLLHLLQQAPQTKDWRGGVIDIYNRCTELFVQTQNSIDASLSTLEQEFSCRVNYESEDPTTWSLKDPYSCLPIEFADFIVTLASPANPSKLITALEELKTNLTHELEGFSQPPASLTQVAENLCSMLQTKFDKLKCMVGQNASHFQDALNTLENAKQKAQEIKDLIQQGPGVSASSSS